MRLVDFDNCRIHWKILKAAALVSHSALLLAVSLSFCAASCPAAGLSDVNFKQAGKFITALERDDHGRVWIGTEDEGVLVCDPAGDGKLKQFTTADGLGDNNAYALACDGQGWIDGLSLQACPSKHDCKMPP